MNERELNDRLAQLEVLARDTHDSVVRLTTLMNGGPGQSFLCNQHRSIVSEMDRRVTGIEHKSWYFMGSLGVFMFLFGLFGPSIRHILKLP